MLIAYVVLFNEVQASLQVDDVSSEGSSVKAYSTAHADPQGLPHGRDFLWGFGSKCDSGDEFADDE